ncbi:ComF family protein [Shewanella waksmanii]|uniref:ComF family protein n=1 Tax=Shewanella waksmanii TaxID=213783 RepID=UPI00373542BF
MKQSRIWSWLQKGWRWLTAGLPNRCLMCHQQVEQDSQGVCGYCIAISVYQHHTCLGCGKPLVIAAKYCGGCQRQQPLVVIAACRYYDGLGQWVAAIKYQTQFAALPPLSQQLVARIEYALRQQWIRLPQALIPVPLHGNRLRQRGFNQAWLISQRLSRALSLPIEDACVMRITDTPPQAGLSGKQRRINVDDAFTLARPISYQRIALIDDVVTTGTTVAAIAQLLAQHGVHVQVWCLARAEAPQLTG